MTLPQSQSPFSVQVDPTAQQEAPADTSETPADTLEEGVVQDINDAFTEAVNHMLAGRWEEVFSILSSDVLIQLLGEFLPRVLAAILAFVVLYATYRAIDSMLARVLDRSQRVDAGLQNLLLKTYRVTALVLIGVIVLGQLGVNTVGLVAGLSIAGIALGFAARDSLENFISGITILIDEPFKVGDNIEIGDQFGEVDEITLRSTRIRTVRNEIVIVPNTQMITEQLINHTKRNTLRVDIPFGIAYKEYPAEAREVLLPLVADDDRILQRPAPTVVVTEMADSSVNMALRFYLRNPKEEVPVRWEYTEKVREALREADIEIPFPHLQLFIDEAKAFAEVPFAHPPQDGE